ncbi:MAG: hypothetical protein WC812_03340 [Candidatus Pacearchaeota archaeon]|jgi:hypothetical protein
MSLTSRLKNFCKKINEMIMYTGGQGPHYSNEFYNLFSEKPYLLDKVVESNVESRHSKEYISSVTHEGKDYTTQMIDLYAGIIQNINL